MHYKLCVIGNPISHSKSPWIHQQFAKQFGLSLTYSKIQSELNDFSNTLENFKNNGGFGLNVTSPFKQEAFNLSQNKSLRATVAKSVNTILFTPQGIWSDNTDGIGFINDITKNLNITLANKVILVLGAGGAVRGIMEPLLSQQPKEVIIANRTKDNAKMLAADFKKMGYVRECGLDELQHLTVDGIIDGTGFDSSIALPASLKLTENSFCYDLKYSDNYTSLMTWAKQNNCQHIHDGIGMLVEQAAEAFFIWTGKKPETSSIICLAKKNYSDFK